MPTVLVGQADARIFTRPPARVGTRSLVECPSSDGPSTSAPAVSGAGGPRVSCHRDDGRSPLQELTIGRRAPPTDRTVGQLNTGIHRSAMGAGVGSRSNARQVRDVMVARGGGGAPTPCAPARPPPRTAVPRRCPVPVIHGRRARVPGLSRTMHGRAPRTEPRVALGRLGRDGRRPRGGSAPEPGATIFPSSDPVPRSPRHDGRARACVPGRVPRTRPTRTQDGTAVKPYCQEFPRIPLQRCPFSSELDATDVHHQTGIRSEGPRKTGGRRRG